MTNPYTEHGYKDRNDYLCCLALDHDTVPLETIFALADVLGENEDFDGLVTALEDAAHLQLIDSGEL